VPPLRKPTWQQATALVSLSTCGAMTGFAFAHGTVDEMTSPTRMPVKLVALDKPAKPEQAGDSALRAAIVKVAKYYLRMAQSKSPAEMEAMIWGVDSIDGANHGQSCAAFASLTLALGAQSTGQQSWVTGGTTYPWPLHKWADVRVDLNPDSPQIVSVMQDAQAHHRWHPLGDGYRPRPGDWVLFDGHVEVVTSYSSGALRTIGGDSAPNLSVNAHTFSGSLAAQGVNGFVNNGQLLSAVSQEGGSAAGATATAGGSAQVETAGFLGQGQAGTGGAAVPGTTLTSVPTATAEKGGGRGTAQGHDAKARKGATRMVGTAGRPGSLGTQSMVAMPGAMGDVAGGTGGADGAAAEAGDGAAPARAGAHAGSQGRQGSKARQGSQARQGSRTAGGPGTAVIPGLEAPTADAHRSSPAPSGRSYTRNVPSAEAMHVPGTAAQQAFISQIAPGAIAMQSRYGIPAAVTIAQAIDESGWGQSVLAIRDHNLFGIKGTGPAGTDMLPTQEFQNGQYVTVNAPFRVYHNVAQSIADHGHLLATSSSYQHAMADRHLPDAFATDLTGVYATDPHYGSNLIAIMKLYNLYRYSAPDAQQAAPAQAAPAPAAVAQVPAAQVPAAQVPAGPGGQQGGTANINGTGNQAGTFGLGGVVDLNGQASQGGSDSQGGPARQGGSASTSRPGSQGGGATQSWSVSAGGSASQRRPASQASAAGPGGATIPGIRDAYQSRPASSAPNATAPLARAPHTGRQAARAPQTGRPAARVAPRQAGTSQAKASRYAPKIPQVVTAAFVTTAKEPLSRAEPLYDDVASRTGIRWQLLAACDWMQCQAKPRYSPVYGEKLGTVNAGGTVYRTKSEALGQCASDLIELAMAVYWIDITARRPLSVRDLAKVFAAFRWGGLLKLHGVSAMEFPYSVAGLTDQHVKMRWPDIKEPNAPDKPGTRFRMAFGAVPAVLCLGYPAIA
jgi:flagellum-specific peptidoglycan hydrolase FlgJ